MLSPQFTCTRCGQELTDSIPPRIEEALDFESCPNCEYPPPQGHCFLRGFIWLLETGKDTVSDPRAPLLVKGMLRQAIARGATDVHIGRMNHQQSILSYRIRGKITNVAPLSDGLANRCLAVLRNLASAAGGGGNSPIEGRILLKYLHRQPVQQFDMRTAECRLTTIHGWAGEAAALRLNATWDPVSDSLKKNPPPPNPFVSLGMSAEQASQFTQQLSARTGTILIVGKTGGGKSRTMGVAVSSVLESQRRVCTIEDPPECGFPGAVQLKLDVKKGLGFETLMPLVLRMDPDAIVIGEVRDPQSAIGLRRAAGTGHLVLGTLHADDSSLAVSRLDTLGYRAQELAPLLSLICAQSLIQIFCTQCNPRSIPLRGMTDASTPLVRLWHRSFKGCQCMTCDSTGYTRTGVFELFPASPRLRSILEESTPDSAALRVLAKEQGMVTMFARGQELVRAGLTDNNEVAMLPD